MKHSLRRILSLVFVFIMLLSLEVPAFAADSTIRPRTGRMNIYLDNSNGQAGTCTLTLASGKNKFTIKRDSVSVSGCGAKISSFQRIISDQETDTVYDDPGAAAYVDYNCIYTVSLQVKKTGTVKIKYSIGAKEYTLKVKVLPYENPIKTIKLTGVNNSKSFASLTKTSTRRIKQLSLKATAKNASLVIKPAVGWKVNWVEFEDAKTHFCYSFGNSSNDRNGVSSLTLSLGTLRVNRDYYLRVRMYNPTTDCSISFCYTLHGAKAGS